ncbi:MAG TPA: BON domain-containing protein [Gammaproteobacteria bacterium]|nr:BON domain-containing protein [Gammaproteobacteria bacterium]
MKLSLIERLKKYSIILLAGVSFSALAATSNTMGAAVSDSVITGKIKSSLAMNEVTHALNIGVETNNGVVTLKGTAGSTTEASKAIEISESTVGVNNVNASQLLVSSSTQPLTDTYITAKIKGVFLKNNLATGIDVKVETQDGVALLSGVVHTAAQREKLIALAKSVDGVSSVKSTLSLKK